MSELWKSYNFHYAISNKKRIARITFSIHPNAYNTWPGRILTQAERVLPHSRKAKLFLWGDNSRVEVFIDFMFFFARHSKAPWQPLDKLIEQRAVWNELAKPNKRIQRRRASRN